MNIDLKTTILFYNIMSFSISSRGNIEDDILIEQEFTINTLRGFFSFFGDLSRGSKGQTIVHNGENWVKSEKKTFL